MRNKNKLFFYLAIGVFFVFNACNMPSGGDSGVDGSEAMFTKAAETLAAHQTQTQAAGFWPTSTAGPAQATATSSIPTATNTAVPTPATCDWAGFITDVTIPDGSFMTPGQDFTKVWRLVNWGVCTWTADYELIFVRGHGMNSTASVPLGEVVLPGGTVDVAVDFAAPVEGGEYKGYWMLRNASGIVFGLGSTADQPFWVAIEVIEPNPNYAYDFAIQLCEAHWQSQELGNMPCPGDNDNQDGFVDLLMDPILENKTENEPAIWVHPDENLDGWVTGTYPPIAIENGDHFVGWVGCLAESPGCNLTFSLDYRIGGGAVQNLGSWVEVHDGDVSVIDLDLSSLAGNDVTFIFVVEINGGQPPNANGFWFVPHIQR
jgi:hypothetical protein